MKKNYLALEKIDAYEIAYDLSNHVWEIVQAWDNFAKWTLGKQLVKAVDSISANIAEGFGRYYKKEKIQFYRYSFGSMKESTDWVQKAGSRGLLNQVDQSYILQELKKLPFAINHLIKYTDEKLKF